MSMTTADLIQEFRSAMRAAGLNYVGDILPDGKLHRVNCEGENGTATWYVAHVTDKFMAGSFGDWRKGGLKETWNSSKSNGTQLSKEDWNNLNRKIAESEALRRTEEEQIRFESKTKAQQILSAAKPAEAHLYLARKSVEPHGEIRINDKNELCLPLRDEQGVLHSMQFIAPDKRYSGNRDKDFIFGGRVNGCFYTISDRTDGPLVICEGYATGASVYEATGYATVCAMFCGNLLPVAQALRKKYPERDFIFAADNDRFTASNPGTEKATAAAKVIKATVAIPQFSDSDTESTDFNDLADVSGIKAVKETVELAYRDFLLPKFASLPRPKNAADLYSDKTLKAPDLLIDRILHEGLKMVIGSGSKAYKSWILLDIAVSIAAGILFWMFKTKRAKVLILNFEIPEWSIKERLVSMANRKGAGLESLRNIDVWSLRGYGTELFKLLPDLIRQVKFGGYGLVILDPIYKVLGGRDENAAGDVAMMCNELESIAVQTGAAILYAAHFSKGNQSEKEAMDRIGGSGVFGRDPDTIVTLTKHEEEDAYTVDTILRNLARVEPFVMKLDFPVYVQQENADPEALKRSGANKSRSSFDPEDILRPLRDGSMETKNWLKNVSTETGVSRAQFYRIRDQLQKEGRVSRDPMSGLWRLQTPRAASSSAPAEPDLPEIPESEQELRVLIDRAAESQ